MECFLNILMSLRRITCQETLVVSDVRQNSVILSMHRTSPNCSSQGMNDVAPFIDSLRASSNLDLARLSHGQFDETEELSGSGNRMPWSVRKRAQRRSSDVAGHRSPAPRVLTNHRRFPDYILLRASRVRYLPGVKVSRLVGVKP